MLLDRLRGEIIGCAYYPATEKILKVISCE